MDAAAPTAEAVVTSGKRIVYVGSRSGALAQRRWYSTVIDLHGKTLMPGLIDAHSHFLATGLASILVDLNASPMGNVDTLDALYQQVADAAATLEEGEWIVGFNYDNTRFPSAAHPDRLALDAVAAEHPVYVRHHSGHMGVANTLGLQRLLKLKDAGSLSTATLQDQLGLDDLQEGYSSTEVASLGLYADSRQLNGLLQESMAPSLSGFLQELSPLDYWRVFKKARDSYTQYGYTLVQEGGAGSGQTRVLKWLSRLRLLPQRVNVWLHAGKASGSTTPATRQPLRQPFFVANTIKITADGSPQGGTAYLSKPYANAPHSHGIALHDHRELMRLISRYWRAGFRVAIHANGDAAIDNVLHAVELLQQQSRLSPSVGRMPGPRLILVHAQTIRADQLARLKALDISPSFFSAHSWYWGDWHRQQTLGAARAATISPTGSAGRLQLDYTIHSDAPVTSPDPWTLLWITTERRTRSGWLLGADERVSIVDGLRAMTINAARQAGLHDSLGSITAGKLADMIVVSGNPLQVDDVRQLRVEQTIINGVNVYRSDGGPTAAGFDLSDAID